MLEAEGVTFGVARKHAGPVNGRQNRCRGNSRVTLFGLVNRAEVDLFLVPLDSGP